MTLKESVESDIRKFLNDIEDQSLDDKIRTLRLLMDKYIHLTTADLLLEKYDFEMIKSGAITLYTEKKWPKKLGKYEDDIVGNEVPKVCLIESTITYLNSKDCLKKLPKFNYKK